MVDIKQELISLIFDFSNSFGVNPPRTNNLGVWWDEALKEMDIGTLRALYENNGYEGSLADSKIAKMMDTMIEIRITELEGGHLGLTV